MKTASRHFAVQWSFLINVAALPLVSTTALKCRAQTFELLHEFLITDGHGPLELVEGSDGNFYGTTRYGGDLTLGFWSGPGSVFKMARDGTLTTLAWFNGDNGANPVAGVIEASDGNFYGTTTRGGAGGNGSVFQMTPDGTLSTLVAFDDSNGNPQSGLMQASDGYLYGTTYDSNDAAGRALRGGIFRTSLDGTLTVLVQFPFSTVNGFHPTGDLTEGIDGNFYGTTEGGGANLMGTIFQMTPTGTLKTLVSLDKTNGCSPEAVKLTQAPDGSLYGTTSGLGCAGVSTVFKVTPKGVLTTLVTFSGTNGSGAWGAPVLARNGNLYGTTFSGGVYGNGTIYQIDPGGTFTSLFSFNGTNGAGPMTALIQAKDGNLYGTTLEGGARNAGTVFRLTFGISLKVVRSGDTLVISWPSSVNGGILESLPSLPSPDWTPLPVSPVVIEDQQVITVPIAQGAQFFRLRRP